MKVNAFFNKNIRNVVKAWTITKVWTEQTLKMLAHLANVGIVDVL